MPQRLNGNFPRSNSDWWCSNAHRQCVVHVSSLLPDRTRPESLFRLSDCCTKAVFLWPLVGGAYGGGHSLVNRCGQGKTMLKRQWTWTLLRLRWDLRQSHLNFKPHVTTGRSPIRKCLRVSIKEKVLGIMPGTKANLKRWMRKGGTKMQMSAGKRPLM